MRRESLAIGGAFGASLLVASCCLAPALFLLFGVSVGALGWLGVFEPYRPVFIALGALALALAGWRIFRTAPSEAACAEGSCLPESPTRRRTRRLFVAASVFYGVAILYPWVLAWLYA